MTAYRVVYELDADGIWVADAPDLRGAHTQGRTIPGARARIREVIALVEHINDESSFDLEETFRAPGDAGQLIYAAREARERARKAQAEADEMTAAAARSLAAVGMSTRDAGEVLGISHGRVHQLVKGRTTKRSAASGRFPSRATQSGNVVTTKKAHM